MTNKPKALETGLEAAIFENPPTDIIHAAQKLEHYFRSRGHDSWKLCGVQNRIEEKDIICAFLQAHLESPELKEALDKAFVEWKPETKQVNKDDPFLVEISWWPSHEYLAKAVINKMLEELK